MLFHILLYFSSISLSLSKRFMYLLFLSRHLAYAFLWGSFILNGAGKALPLCIYPIKYLNNSSLPYYFVLDNTVLFISTSLIWIDFLFLWKLISIIPYSPKSKAFCFIFYAVKIKKVKIFYFNFLVIRQFFWYSFNFCFFSLDILWYPFLPYSIFIFLSSSGDFLYWFFSCFFNTYYYFYNSLLLYLVLHLYIFCSKSYHSLFIYRNIIIHFFLSFLTF